MDDGQRETISELKADAAADQAVFSLPCPECGVLIAGSHSDLDAHLQGECAEGWPIYLDDLLDDGSDEEESAA